METKKVLVETPYRNINAEKFQMHNSGIGILHNIFKCKVE